MMQLATSQRPHPPPVPPRPSRQVVAEALKRSPRPPCPTRQAPPPPNTRPWRSEDHETNQGRGGRTVIYESMKESSNCDEVRASSEPRQIKAFSQPDRVTSRRRSDETRSESSDKIGKESNVEEKIMDDRIGSNRATSERYEAENHRERQNNKPQQPHEKKSQLPQLRSNDKELRDRENSMVGSSENGDDVRSGKNEKAFISNPETNGNVVKPAVPANMTIEVCNIGSMSEEGLGNERGTLDDRCRSDDDAIGKKFVRLMETEFGKSPNDNTAENTKEDTSKNGTKANGTKSPKCSIAENLVNHRSEKTRMLTELTETTKVRNIVNNENFDTRNKINPAFCRGERDDSVETTYGSSTTISSDECATVVVIDEPERKIAFNEDNDNIHHQDWLEAGVRYSSTKITLPGDETTDRCDESSHLDNDNDHDEDDRNAEDGDDTNGPRAYTDLDFASIRERIAMSSLQGLPPLPRSLSGFNLNEGRREGCEPPPPPARSSSKTPKNIKSALPSSSKPSPPGRQLTTLDTQLAILRKEMFGLRQLDLSLLSQLWSLNESIQEFRQLLQDQEDRAPSPSPSSDEGDDTSYGSHPPPPPRRPAPLLHHHRPPRPPRPLRPPASDESPSSEEYGAV